MEAANRESDREMQSQHGRSTTTAQATARQRSATRTTRSHGSGWQLGAEAAEEAKGGAWEVGKEAAYLMASSPRPTAEHRSGKHGGTASS